MPLTESGLKEIRRNLKRFTKSAVAERAKRAAGGPVNVLFEPWKFPPTRGENPKSDVVIRKVAELIDELIG